MQLISTRLSNSPDGSFTKDTGTPILFKIKKINMIMSNQKRVDRELFAARNACHGEKMSFKIGFEDSESMRL